MKVEMERKSIIVNENIHNSSSIDVIVKYEIKSSMENIESTFLLQKKIFNKLVEKKYIKKLDNTKLIYYVALTKDTYIFSVEERIDRTELDTKISFIFNPQYITIEIDD